MEDKGSVQTGIPSCEPGSETGRGSRVLTQTKELQPLGSDPGLDVVHLSLQSPLPALSPLPPPREVVSASSNRLPRPLGLLGFGPWETPTGDPRAESRVQWLVLPAPLCPAAGNPVHFPSVSGLCPLPLYTKSRGYNLGALCLSLWFP